MTTYRLNLTGEYEGRILADCANVRLQLPDGGTVTVPVELATEVKPPLPPEPKPWAVVSDSHGKVWQNIGKEPAPWRCTDGRTTNWEGLNGPVLGPVSVLIVDPADDAPELPWETNDGTVGVKRGDTPDTVAIEVTDGDYSADEAQQIAHAILRGVRAAREVEQP